MGASLRLGRDDYEHALEGLTDKAAAALADVIDRMPAGLDVNRTRDLLVSAVNEIAHSHGRRAGFLALGYMEETGLLQGLHDIPPIADVAEREAIRRAVIGITKDMQDGQVPSGVRTRLEKLLIKHVRTPANETVVALTKAARGSFARLPNAGACRWCMMLAARGAVYTKDTVTTTKVGRKYHDGCRCTAVHVRNTADLPAVNRLLAEAFNKGIIDTEMSTQEFYQALRDAGVSDWRVVAGIRNYAGSIERPPGVKLHQHEIETAERLKSLGYSVEFIKPSTEHGVKTPDCYVNGVLTDLKSPKSVTTNGVRQHLRASKNQKADQAIVDLNRSPLASSDATARAEDGVREFFRRDEDGSMRVYLLTKDVEIVEIVRR